MSVNAVNEYSTFNTVTKSTAVGVATGYALKYLWPVNSQEQNISPKKFVNLGRKVANENKIEELSLLPERTPAQDCFIKMAKSKDKSTFLRSNVAKEIESLGEDGGKELRTIIDSADKSARQIYKHLSAANNLMLRHIRPVVPFLVVGAGAGFITGIMKNIIRNDV